MELFHHPLPPPIDGQKYERPSNTQIIPSEKIILFDLEFTSEDTQHIIVPF